MGHYESVPVRVETGNYAQKGDGDLPACKPGGPASCFVIRADLDLGLDPNSLRVSLFCREERATGWTQCQPGQQIPQRFGYFSDVDIDDAGVFLTVSVEFRNWRNDGARFVQMKIDW